jgi:hypothetical protein
LQVASPALVAGLAALGVQLALAAPAGAAPYAGAIPPSRVGYDVSHPQCGTELPADRAFGVVGVNGGLATRANPCLREQLAWAAGSSGVTDQPELQLYLNTANPGQQIDEVTTWPTDGATPYGGCEGGNDQACSWEYGWERAANSVVSFFAPAARANRLDSGPHRYTWWLDVETSNTWQAGSSDARARNLAALEGMAAYLESQGAEVGLYSTGQQWRQIVGTVPEGSPLADLDSWLAGSVTYEQAVEACSAEPLVPGGRVALTQYVPDGLDGLDHDHSCR